MTSGQMGLWLNYCLGVDRQQPVRARLRDALVKCATVEIDNKRGLPASTASAFQKFCQVRILVARQNPFALIEQKRFLARHIGKTAVGNAGAVDLGDVGDTRRNRCRCRCRTESRADVWNTSQSSISRVGSLVGVNDRLR
jgi:hypothetical protein